MIGQLLEVWLRCILLKNNIEGVEKDYNYYYVSKRMILWIFCRAILCSCGLVLFFYSFPKGLIVAIPLAFILIKVDIQKRIMNVQKELLVGFREALTQMYTNLSVGLSLENCFLKVAEGLKVWDQVNDDVYREFMMISQKLSYNYQLEKVFKEFALRSRLKEIRLFAELMPIFRTTGGDVRDIIKYYIDSIGETIELQEEVKTMISAKTNEFKLMMIIPLGVILYMRLTSIEFSTILYDNILGMLMMTLGLTIYVCSWIFGEKLIHTLSKEAV